MEINFPNPAAFPKSLGVSLYLPQVVTWEKLPVWLLKCSTIEKKDTSAGVLLFLLFYTGQIRNKAQGLQSPVGQL